jgi:hypothetical protein
MPGVCRQLSESNPPGIWISSCRIYPDSPGRGASVPCLTITTKGYNTVIEIHVG